MRMSWIIILCCVAVTVCLLFSSAFIGENTTITVYMPWFYISVWAIGGIFAFLFRNSD